jgi:hypothetical protein
LGWLHHLAFELPGNATHVHSDLTARRALPPPDNVTSALSQLCKFRPLTYAPSMRGDTLELITRNGRTKYQLAGHVLNGGDPIPLCFSGGWVIGRFEWSGELDRRPLFHYSLELVTDGDLFEAAFEIPEGAILRWPDK